MISSSFPHRGEVYLVSAIRATGDTKKRPSILVSTDSQNQYASNVILVPLTSDLEGIALPTRVLIRTGEGGIAADSLAVCERIMTVKQSYLEHGPYGSVTPETIARILAGIQVAIGAGRF